MLVDLHHHLVYGVDDGCRNREMAEAMLARAAAQGVTHIACTSHTRPGEHDLNMERYLRHIDTLNGIICEKGYDITLFTGCEIMYTYHTPRLLREGRVPTLGGTQNVLVEFMPETPYDLIRRALMDTAEAGHHVVLAHVERYACLHDEDKLAAIKGETYPTLQMNADTVLRAKGLFGDRFAKRVLKNGLIDVVGSDAHSDGTRCCRLGEAHAFLAGAYDEAYADALCRDEPAALLGL